MQNLIGKTIANYRLTDFLGSGGMGEVYKAYNADMRRTAAVKILHNQEQAARFQNEAYVQSLVNHPNIATVYEYLVFDQMPCIIMEYVEGITLDNYVKRKGRLSNNDAERIVQQIASALAFLHAKDIIHRDIKPQNIKVLDNGLVKLLDFGISKTKYSPKITKEGFAIGTTEYMAPEQFAGKTDKKSDIWSFGVMIYEMLTGYLPFEGSTPHLIRTKIETGGYTKPLTLVPNLSEKLVKIIEKSLRTNPQNRASADEILAILEGKKESKKLSNPAILQINFRPKINTNTLIYSVLGVALGLILIIGVLSRKDDNSPDNTVTNDEKNTTEVVDSTKLSTITINVTAPQDAEIVLPDGNHYPTPYTLKGEHGKSVEFLLRAEGYQEKKVQVDFQKNEDSYDYLLDKKNY